MRMDVVAFYNTSFLTFFYSCILFPKFCCSIRDDLSCNDINRFN